MFWVNDYEKAFKWFKLSFEEDNDEDSAYELGELYYYGEGIEENEEPRDSIRKEEVWQRQI